MTTLPAGSDLGGSPTQGTFKTKIQDLRTFIADLLGTDSGNKPAARAALGISATGETLVSAASKAAARGALDLPGTLTGLAGYRIGVDAAGAALPLIGPDLGLRNAVINGDFRLAQRGTSFASPAGGSYTLDRCKVSIGSGNTLTVSRQAHALGDIGGEPAFYLHMDKTAGSGAAPEAHWPLEGVRTFAGKKVTVSFKAKASVARDLVVGLTQNFGTGGSPSSTVSPASQTQALTTAWAWYSKTFTLASITGKTLGSNGDDHLDLALNWGANTNGSISISELQIEEGEVATPFERRPIAVELAMAERYYEKSYAIDVAPATVTAVGQEGFLAPGFTGFMRHTVRFRTRKRKIPTVLLYSPATGSSTDVRLNNASELAYNLNWIAPTKADIEITRTWTAGDFAWFHYTADAEI